MNDKYNTPSKSYVMGIFLTKSGDDSTGINYNTDTVVNKGEKTIEFGNLSLIGQIEAEKLCIQASKKIDGREGIIKESELINKFNELKNKGEIN